MIFLSALAMFPCSVTWRRFSSSTGAELKPNPCLTIPPSSGSPKLSSTVLIHFRWILDKSELKQSWNSSLACRWSRFTAWANSWGLQSSNPGMNPAQEPDDATGCKSPCSGSTIFIVWASEARSSVTWPWQPSAWWPAWLGWEGKY